MPEGCIFCKIVEKKIQSKVVYEDRETIAFEDRNPQAPVHIVIIPKKHLHGLLDLKSKEDYGLVSHIFEVINKLVKDKGLVESGFRVVANCGPDSGQAVFHLHFHLFGGRKMGWPPG